MIERIMNYLGWIRISKIPKGPMIIERNSLKPIVIKHQCSISRDRMMEHHSQEITIEQIKREIFQEIAKQIEPYIITESSEDFDGSNKITSKLIILKND